MTTVLKEWAVVIEALARGEQLFLLRKGGIAEGKRGFELKHQEFLFFPTWEHQHAGLVRPEYHALLDGLKPQRNDTLDLTYWGRVSDIVPAPRSVEQMRLLEPHHIWTDGFIQKRYQYRPDLPLKPGDRAAPPAAGARLHSYRSPLCRLSLVGRPGGGRRGRTDARRPTRRAIRGSSGAAAHETFRRRSGLKLVPSTALLLTRQLRPRSHVFSHLANHYRSVVAICPLFCGY